MASTISSTNTFCFLSITKSFFHCELARDLFRINCRQPFQLAGTCHLARLHQKVLLHDTRARVAFRLFRLTRWLHVMSATLICVFNRTARNWSWRSGLCAIVTGCAVSMGPDDELGSFSVSAARGNGDERGCRRIEILRLRTAALIRIFTRTLTFFG